MNRVGNFTTIFDAECGFSIIAVAETLVRMLLDHDYDPVVLVQDQFSKNQNGAVQVLPFKEVPPPSIWNKQMVDLRPVVPPLELTQKVGPDFEARVSRILHALRDNLTGVDVCITQDIILQEWYKEHNVAMRRYARERPDLLWLHWIHSVPSGKAHQVTKEARATPEHCRHTPPPGYIIYPNDVDRNLVAQAYGVPMHAVKPCRAGHALDPLLLWPYHELTKILARKADLLGGEVVTIYPARLDRGKKVEKIIRLLAGVQRAGHETRLLILDWQSAGPRFQAYKDELLELGDSLGLWGKVHISSRMHDGCSQGVPRRVVLELMDLANVYIHPSESETYSLVVHEAITRGNLVVLNHDLPPMRELFRDCGIYMDFGSTRTSRKYKPDEQSYWNDEALRLIAELKQNRALMARTRALREWSPQALWREFEPLLHLPPDYEET